MIKNFEFTRDLLDTILYNQGINYMRLAKKIKTEYATVLKKTLLYQKQGLIKKEIIPNKLGARLMITDKGKQTLLLIQKLMDLGVDTV